MMQKQLEQLIKEFERFRKETNDRLEVLIKQNQVMQDSINRLDRDIGEDRKDITDIKLKVSNMDGQLDEFRGLFNQQTQKLKETIKEEVKK